jgi:hypothetical protein
MALSEGAVAIESLITAMAYLFAAVAVPIVGFYVVFLGFGAFPSFQQRCV